MTSNGELQTMNRNVLPMPHLCLCLQRDFQTLVIPRTLDQKQSGVLLTTKDHKENGTVAELMMIKSEKADTQFSEQRVHCPEERSKAKEVENYLFTSVLMGKLSKLFFAQSFLLISSASTEQSQICVRNTVLVKQVRGDPYCRDNLTHRLSQQVC